MIESDEGRNIVLVDSELSRQLEGTEGLASARFIEARNATHSGMDFKSRIQERSGSEPKHAH